jgi:predicted metal-binding membrane protein
MTFRLQDIFWLGFFALVLLAWAGLYLMSFDAGVDLFGRPGLWAETLRALCTGPQAGAAQGLAVWAMWAGMSVAMMLPTFVPVLVTHQRVSGRLDDPAASRLGLVGGYLAVWLGFSVLAAAGQIGLSRAGLVDGLGVAQGAALQGGLLIVAGLWQFTGAKSRCQTVCLTPMAYFLGRFRPGALGGARMGLELGAYCVGCCWAIMALGFVGGVMNLAWMGLATLFMVLEKLPEVGQGLRRPAGALLTVGGLSLWAVALT